MTDGRWVVAGKDRNACARCAYTRTSDGLLIVGSETGMVVVPNRRSSPRAGWGRAR
jgi:glutamate synthase (NADPH) large chain